MYNVAKNNNIYSPIDELFNFIYDFENYSEIPKIDIIDNSDSLLIEAETSGYKKDDIKIKIENNYLYIIGNAETTDEKRKYLYRERKINSSFKRKLKIDTSQYNINKIEAIWKDGILNITIPKLEKKIKENYVEIK